MAFAAPAQAEKRVALVIGINDYRHLPSLNNAETDAKGMASKLRSLGFDVTLKLNARQRDLYRALDAFEGKLSGGATGLVFYAGHGIQADGHNYLIPTDADVEVESDLAAEALPAERILAAMERAGNPMNIIILDACRDNPLPKRSRSAARGLTVLNMPRGAKGTAILYAAGPNQTAQDGDPGGHGLFTGALLKAMGQPGLKLEEIFKQVSREVVEATGGRQRPWSLASLQGDFYFMPGAANKSAATKSGNNAEIVFWQSIQSSKQASDYEAYLSQYPDGAFTALARSRAAQYKPQQVATLPPEPQPAPRPSYRVQAMDETLFVVKTANVRSEPSATSDKLGLLDAGRPVGVTGRTEISGATWYRVALANGEAGYVYGSLLGEREPTPVRPAAPVRTGNLSPGNTFRDCENALVATAGRSVPSGVFCGPEMVVIPSGSFQMGSNGGDGDEKPVHRVNIGYQFAVGKFEVTRGQFAEFVRATGYDAGNSCYVFEGSWKKVDGKSWRNPGFSQTDSHPVACVDWSAAKAYVKWLSGKSGQRYRLLSESEWEYVARAGTTTTYSWGNSAGSGNANCDGCGSRWDNKETAPVGSFRANPFGVHDMHGNVWEWVQDCSQDSYANAPTDGRARTIGDCRVRVLRGGSWDVKPRFLRSANRVRVSSGDRGDYYGFRIARTF
ncbi:hypothetical protein JCM17960_00310 [Magnetospira thiophila]